MWRKIREEWRRREKKNEDEDEEADGENWMIERNNDVLFYQKVLASGKFYKFSKSNWIGLSVCICVTNFSQFLITCDVLNSCREYSKLVMTGRKMSWCVYWYALRAGHDSDKIICHAGKQRLGVHRHQLTILNFLVWLLFKCSFYSRAAYM